MRESYASIVRQEINDAVSFVDTMIGVDDMDVCVLVGAVTRQTADGQMMSRRVMNLRLRVLCHSCSIEY